MRREYEPVTGEVVNPPLPRKPAKVRSYVTVPQTDTGRRGEKPQALEITLAKELGKLAP